MSPGTSDIETDIASTARQRILSDGVMEFAVRQALAALAGQADHTADFFDKGWFDDDEGQAILKGCVRNTYGVLANLNELSGQADALDVSGDVVDPRWHAIGDLQRGADALWKKNWTEDAVRFAVAADGLREEAVALPDADGRKASDTKELRDELAEEGELADLFDKVAAALMAEAGERGVSAPKCILVERLYRATGGIREDSYVYADWWTIAGEMLGD